MSREPARFLAIAFFSLISLAPAFAGVNSWTVSGPPGGFVRDLEISTTDSNVYYAAYSHTIFRSTDGAVTWQAARHFVAEVVDIAVDPTDGNRVYVAALEDGVWRSDDRGQTFTKIAGTSLGIQVWSVGVGGADGQTVYYATNSSSFYQSTDRGQNWTPRTPTTPTLTNLLVDRQDGNAIHASRGMAIMRSTDGGQSWNETAVPHTRSLIRVSANELVIATENGIYSSTDNGANFTIQTTGSFDGLAVDPASPGTVVATRNAEILYRRSGSGGSWSSFGTSQTLGLPQKVAVGGGTPSRLVTASSNGILRSTDDGMTWTESSSGPVASSISGKMAAVPGPNAKVYAFVAGLVDGLFSNSLDQGWQRQNVRAAATSVGQFGFGQSTIAVRPGSPQTIFLGTWAWGVFRSNDGGNTWGPAGSGLANLGVRALEFDPVDPNIMYANVMATNGASPPASLYRSTDGGVTWSPRSVNFPNIVGMRLVVDPANRDRLFLAGHQSFYPAGWGGLYRSVDGGLNWTQSFAGIDVLDVAVDPSDSNRVYAATASGLQVSVNGGDTFAPNNAFSVITSLPASAIAIDPVSPTTIYAADFDRAPGATLHVDASSHILRSVDRGQTWEVLRSPSDTPDWYVGNLALDPLQPSLIYATTSVRGIAAFEIQNDLALAVTGHSGLRPTGTASTFNLRATNHGALAATGVRIRAQLPAALTGVTATSTVANCSVASDVVTCTAPVLAPAASFDVRVTYTPPSSMSLPVSAELTAGERDNAPANNATTATATTGEVVDLRVTVTPSSTTPQTGATVTYAIQVTNNGPIDSSGGTLTFGPASGVTLGSSLPSGCTASGSQASCTLGAIAVGASQSFSFTATASTAGSNVASANVTAASTAADADTTNNSASSTLTVSTPPPPQSTNSDGGGGGGSIGYLMLLFALLMTVARLTPIARRR